MATAYYTVHIPEVDLPPNPRYAVLGSRLYFLNWNTKKDESSPSCEMEVLILDTETLQWHRSPMEKEEGSEAVVPPERLGYALAAARGRIFMWGGYSEGSSTADVLWWSPNKRNSAAGAWWKFRLVDQRAPLPRRGHRLFAIDDRYLLLAGGAEIGGRNAQVRPAQEIWVLDLEMRQWKFIRATHERGLYLWEGASYCAVEELPEPRLYVFGCEMFRHHWNGAACLQLPGLVSSQKCDDHCEKTHTPNDPTKAGWQRIVLKSSCSLQWKSPCFAMNGCVYTFDILPGSSCGHCGSTAFSTGPLALWRLSANTHRWEWFRIPSSPRAPLSFNTVGVVDKKVIILGRVCRDGPVIKHRDLHIVDFAPTLQTLCLCAMARHNIDPSPLPPTLRKSFLVQCPRVQK